GPFNRSVFMDGESKLRDEGIALVRVYVAAENQVRQAIKDIGILIRLDALNDMRMVAYDHVRAVADGRPADVVLVARIGGFVLAAPMERRDDNLTSRLAQGVDIVADVALAVPVGERFANQPDFDAAHLIDGRRAGRAVGNARRVQRRAGVRLALVAVIAEVV